VIIARTRINLLWFDVSLKDFSILTKIDKHTYDVTLAISSGKWWTAG